LVTTPWRDPWSAARCNQESREGGKQIHCVNGGCGMGRKFMDGQLDIWYIVIEERDEVEKNAVIKE